MKTFPTILVIAAIFLLALTPLGLASIYIVILSWAFSDTGLIVIALAIMLFAAIRGKINIAWAIFPVTFFSVCGAVFFYWSKKFK